MKEGRPVAAQGNDVEDFAVATLTLETGALIRIACSWRLQAGCDAAIGAQFYGTAGGASFKNIDGSFYDFAAHRFYGTHRENLAEPPDDWGGRAAVTWAGKLAEGRDGYDPACEELIAVADVLDRIYRAAGH